VEKRLNGWGWFLVRELLTIQGTDMLYKMVRPEKETCPGDGYSSIPTSRNSRQISWMRPNGVVAVVCGVHVKATVGHRSSGWAIV